ncbi:hypothetical protein [Sphingobacterium deserti]|uniref:Uncharacterized protein n=1 Tax=Sphingobacterium deserti TaxID=1229276 RepID=A0A0B8T778_9SPHI|nr:hypothetical protein [Sphingobacterium deserti]KGE14219.1 hypothetical protein DI53_2049 [Sphingobacterium deserti]
MENQGQTFTRLYHQALVNPKEVSQEDFDLLLSRYPYSQPLHFAFERRKFLCGELTKLGSRAILLASSPSWLHDYVQLPVQDIPFIAAIDDDLLVTDLTSPLSTGNEDRQEPNNSAVEHPPFAGETSGDDAEPSNDAVERAQSTGVKLSEEESITSPMDSERVAALDPSSEGTSQHEVEATDVDPKAGEIKDTDDDKPLAEEAAVSDVVPSGEPTFEPSVEESLTAETEASDFKVGEEAIHATTEHEPSANGTEIPSIDKDEERVVDLNDTELLADESKPADSEEIEHSSLGATEEQHESEGHTAPDRARHVDINLENLPDLTKEEENAALDNLVHEGIGGGDYFALHTKEIRWETNVGLSGNNEADSNSSVISEPVDQQKEEDVSVYNDDLMPYSFRWWLHKTRLEYADTYQPFASPHLPTNKKSSFDPEAFDKVVLDQQIRENIIHLQSPEDKLSEEVKQRAVTYSRVDKTTEVIERFIREEPQIQPPPADQLTMENKARKSSEEQFNLVTETLANIYASQGMYVKAIEVYKKLILRFPEKKSYFATQIKGLEEKLY